MTIQQTHSPIPKDKFIFGLVATFLCGLGFSIVMPITPFLVDEYTSNSSEQAIIVTLLMSTYAACVLIAAPILGALSDRYGRRPILLISLLGSSIGFFIFGVGGSIGMLFLGRIIEGLTGGSISTIFAYFADITPEKERTKYFGWISAVAGFGSAIGPTLGGFLANFSYATPLFFASAVSLLNFTFGYFVMKESHKKELRMTSLTAKDLNPVLKIKEVLIIKRIRYLLMIGFLIWLPNGALQSILSQFSIDSFKLTPTYIGLVFSIVGLQDIFSQTFIMPKLIRRFTDKQIMFTGICFQAMGYLLITLSALFSAVWLFVFGMFLFGFGESIFSPAFNGKLSKTASVKEQGTVQGGSQSVQAFSRIIGPIIGGQLYVILGSYSPTLIGFGLTLVALFFIISPQIKKGWKLSE